MEELTIVEHQRADARVLEVTGELDIFSAPRLRDHAMAEVTEPGRPLVLDLTGVPFMDSAGLGVCISLLKRAAAGRTGPVLVAASPPVLRLLDITGARRAFSVHTSVERALASLGE